MAERKWMTWQPTDNTSKWKAAVEAQAGIDGDIHLPPTKKTAMQVVVRTRLPIDLSRDEC